MQVGRVHIAVSYYYYNTYQYNKIKDRNRYICEMQSGAIILGVLTVLTRMFCILYEFMIIYHLYYVKRLWQIRQK